MKKTKSLIRFFVIGCFALMAIGGAAEATPSTQIWNPSTDIQAAGVTHLGIDNYFTQEGPAQGGYAFPTDLGLTYGVNSNLEVGVDVMAPQSNPFVFNAKAALPENGAIPALAIGGFGFGTMQGVTDQNVLYALAAKSLIIGDKALGRITAGGYAGNDKVLLDPNGNKDASGVILTWDKTINDKLWLCVDYASGKSALGATFYGFSWNFSSNTSVIFGYGTYNNGAKPTYTTQLDINI